MPVEKKPKVYIGISGGVDSSVSAYLLKSQGYDVYGVYLRCWNAGNGCKAEQDESDALKSASFLEIPFEVLDFTKEYANRVMEYFYSEYEKGLTPNPDIMCNSEIKFGAFFDEITKRGPNSYLATGHYVKIGRFENGNYALMSGSDKKKDQSYFLYKICNSQEKLSRILFPLGEMTKEEVRGLAASIGIPNAAKPDSQGICFVGSVNLRQFLEKRISSSIGNVINSDGKVIGRHNGLSYYTIGQRHGFDINVYSSIPLYVIGKNLDDNTLIVGNKDMACRDEFLLTDLILSVNLEKILGDNVSVRIRNLGEKIYCSISMEKSGDIKLKLNQKVFGVAPGQSGVIYSGDYLLGGGVVKDVETSP